MATRHFGDIPGIPEETEFSDRKALNEAGLHLPLQAGISGSGKEGADSIVLSGGYEDDLDEGDVIVYTGHGGRDANTGKQVAHQELERGNLALAINQLQGLPVRVIRGHQHRSPWSPQAGYRYAGLYRVEDHWHERGKSGFTVWRFRLVKIPSKAASQAMELDQSELERDQVGPAARKPVLVQRIVRNTKKARAVKAMYDHTCQVCGVRLESLAGPYAEAAHVRPLGAPHNGPDAESNILCLCPNHHVLFDLGGFVIGDDFSLIGIGGVLRQDPKHKLNLDHVRYHRARYITLET